MHAACDLCHAAKQVSRRRIVIYPDLTFRNAPEIDQHVPDVQLADGIVSTLLDSADVLSPRNSEGHPLRTINPDLKSCLLSTLNLKYRHYNNNKWRKRESCLRGIQPLATGSICSVRWVWQLTWD